jgi:phosphoserine aminotransferase
MLRIIPEYDGLLVRSGTQVTADIINAGKKLSIIGRYYILILEFFFSSFLVIFFFSIGILINFHVITSAGTGVDNIDVDAATKRGIAVINTPGGNTNSAAEMTISLLMSLARNVPGAHVSMKEGKWDRKKYTGTEVSGKTIGILGLGHIGRRVAATCQAMGMHTIGFDPLMSREVARSQYNIEPVSLEDLIERSDFITLHCPLTESTRNLFNDETLKKCKKGVRIINCARGGIIDEMALLRALNSGQVAGAALDVFEVEPPPKEFVELFKHPNVIATPHLGASTGEAQDKVAKEIATHVVNAFEGRAVAGVVNSRLLAEMHARKELAPWIELAERLGSLQSQLLSHGAIKSIVIRTRGTLLKDTRSLLKTGVLKGLLAPLQSGTVNMINAPTIADEMGLEVHESHENASSVHTNSLTVTVFTETGKKKLVGTCTNSGAPRLVQFDDFQIDLAPEGVALFWTNNDRPGFIAAIAKVLADHGVNIASFALGRQVSGGMAVGAVAIDSKISQHVIEKIRVIPGLETIRMTELPPARRVTTTGTPEAIPPPVLRPVDPNFSSGPCKKRPGFDLSALPREALGRSHRSALGVQKLQQVANLHRKVLGIPKTHHIAIMAGSDTGAFEAAMWNLLGPRDIDVFHWEQFGSDWATDITKHLDIKTKINEYKADYGKLPDLSKANKANDIVFTWNGTTSGVKVPNADWIPADREGLTLCDATSAVFAMDIDWAKCDVVTWSWQKALGSEGAHGMLVLSDRAIARLNSNPPKRGMPKIFRLTAKGEFDKGPFEGKPINTPSMLAVEDVIDALQWAERIGGLEAMKKRSNDNLKAVEEFVNERDWINFLAEDAASRSNTSVCLSLKLDEKKVKALTKLLESHDVAYDIDSYRSAPPGIRIWCGSTVETEDVRVLLSWVEWAYEVVRAKK